MAFSSAALAAPEPPEQHTLQTPRTSPAVLQTLWKFDFNGKQQVPDSVRLTSQSLYSEETGYGFLNEHKPSLFAVRVPEGNYKVTLVLGDVQTDSETTIKAEARRLMLEHVVTKAGEFVTRTFVVNVRTPRIAGERQIAINAREKGALNWDDKLSLEFNGVRPAIAALQIEKVDNATTVFIAGDSTVTDQANEPYVGWGQMLPRFFNERVAIANYAESGRALYSFKGEKRLEKILSLIKPNDYLFIQFGHNDQKDKSPGSGPFTTYKANLKFYIAQAQAKGAQPVIITPMERRRWKEDQPQQTLSDFAEAARQTAKEENVPLIDLHAMSLRFYAALGPEKSLKAFVHYPENTFPGQTEALKDDTHFNAYGGYELARCVVEGLKTSVPELAKLLAADVTPFDPSQPDKLDAVRIPASAIKLTTKPAGS